MKTLFTITKSLLFFIVIAAFVASCEKEETTIDELSVPEELEFRDDLLNYEEMDFSVVNPEMGALHNRGLHELKVNTELSPELSPQANLRLIIQYFEANYGVNVRPMLRVHFTNGPNGITYTPLDPFEYLELHSEVVSEHYYQQMTNLLTETLGAYAANNLEAALEIIAEYRVQIADDVNFSPEEATMFINQLYVYESSLNYCTNNDAYNGGDEWDLPSEINWWKVGGADLLGALGGALSGVVTGGTLSGPLAGIGAVVSSGNSIISQW